MPSVVIALTEPSAKLRGLLRAHLIEVQTNVFTGAMSARDLSRFKQAFDETGGRGILIAFSRQSVFGIRVVGSNTLKDRRHVVSIDGLPFALKRQHAELIAEPPNAQA